MGPISPSSSLSSSNPFSAISPKPRHHQPNADILSSSPNTFSSILHSKPQHQEEEEWSVQELEDEDDDDERASMRTEIPKGPLVSYSRTELLKLAWKEGVPQAMPTLESWFGPWSPSKTAATPTYGANHTGHDGEGYQRRDAGLIGRGIGNSGRPRNNIGLRRNPDEGAAAPQPIHHEHDAGYKRREQREHAHHQDGNFKNPFAPSQMGRFGVGKSNLKLGGDEAGKHREDDGIKRDRAPHLAGARTRDGHIDRRAGPSQTQDGDRRRDDNEWRRGAGAKPLAQSNRRQGNSRWQQAHDDDALEPAWMDDEPKASEKPEAVDEPLIKFVPGEDMIAAHKRAMKARAEPSAPPGFFSDPAIAATSATPQPAPKVFNPADYLLPEKDGAGRVEEVEKNSGGSSRFQRFFGGAQASERSSAPAAPQANVLHAPSPVPTSSSRKDDSAMKLDDHMAKLLGMLDVKAASPVSLSRSPLAQPPRSDVSPLPPHQQQPASYGSYHQPPGLSSVPRNQSSSLPPHLYRNDTGSSHFSHNSSPSASSDLPQNSPPLESRLHARMPQQPPQGRFMQQQQLLQQLAGAEPNFDHRAHLSSPPPPPQGNQDPMQALFAQAQAQAQRQQMLQRSVELQQQLPPAQPQQQFNRPPPGMFPNSGPGLSAPDLLRDLQQQQQRGYGPGPGGFAPPPPPPPGHFPPQQYSPYPPPPPGIGRPMFGMMPPPPIGLPAPAVSAYPQQDAMAALFAGLNQGQRAPSG